MIKIRNAYPILTYPDNGSFEYKVEYWNVTGTSQGGFFDIEIPFHGLKGDRVKFVSLVREKLVTL